MIFTIEGKRPRDSRGHDKGFRMRMDLFERFAKVFLENLSLKRPGDLPGELD